MTIITAKKDGWYITELYVNDGPNIAHLVTRADTQEGWAEIFTTNADGEFIYDEDGRALLDRVYGEIRYVDTREREAGS